jgi:hypothetical protein
MVVSELGVDFQHSSTVVRCPWALFNAPGEPFLLKDRVLLPVTVEASHLVEVHINGALQKPGKVKTHQFRFKSSGDGAHAGRSGRYGPERFFRRFGARERPRSGSSARRGDRRGSGLSAVGGF